MQFKLHFCALAVSLFLIAGAAKAGALVYNESSFAGGDFPATGSPNIGTLGVGVNTITGSVNGAPGSLDFEDTFSVTLPAGLVITAGQWSISNFTFGIGGEGSFNGSVSEPIDSAKAASGNGTLNIVNVPYSTPGSLNADIQSAYSQTCDNPGDGIMCRNNEGGFTYTLQYSVVSSVPEPSTGPWLAAGVAALWLMRRYRQG